MSANQDPEILKQLAADRKPGETFFQSWSRKAKKQAHDQKVERAQNDSPETKYREERHEIFALTSLLTPDEFPLELVASVAAKFCKGKNYSEAVERAICLLQECKDTITENKAKKEWNAQKARRMRDPKIDIDAAPGAFKIPFRRAIRRITGQKRVDRAEADYLAFLGATIRGQTTEGRNEIMKSHADGIDAFEVEELTKSFSLLTAQGKISKDRPPKKPRKRLDRET